MCWLLAKLGTQQFFNISRQRQRVNRAVTEYFFDKRRCHNVHCTKGNRFSAIQHEMQRGKPRGIFHVVVSRFPLHFMLFRGNLDYFSRVPSSGFSSLELKFVRFIFLGMPCPCLYTPVMSSHINCQSMMRRWLCFDYCSDSMMKTASPCIYTYIHTQYFSHPGGRCRKIW